MMHFWSALRTVVVVVAYRTGCRLKINRRIRLLHLRFRTVPRAQEVRSRTRSTRPLARYPSGRLRTVVTCRRIREGGVFSIFLRGPHRLYRNRWFDRVWRRKVCAYHKNNTRCCYGPFDETCIYRFLPFKFVSMRRLDALSRTTSKAETCVARAILYLLDFW